MMRFALQPTTNGVAEETPLPQKESYDDEPLF